jgi:chemotaxis protein methyltransferase CheR
METSNDCRPSLPAGAAATLANSPPLMAIDQARALALAIVDTVRDPLLVLDQDLRVVTANRAFYQTFRMKRQDVEGRPVYGLGDGEWDIPELRLLLEDVTSQHAVMEAYAVERHFSGIGRRAMLLNAREVFNQSNAHKLILLAIEDVTARRVDERELAELLQQKETLLQEMQHRVANSLQIIAGILLLKARSVRSEETRLHLRDAHQRVMSVAAVQQQLLASTHGEPIEVGSYLSRLCEGLAASMVDESRPISLQVHAEGSTASSAEAVSIGLIATELVINAFKHAFPGERASGRIEVAYEAGESSWHLAVSDNGIGAGPATGPSALAKPSPGLGTIIVEALAKQLDARVKVTRTPQGTTVSITHETTDIVSPAQSAAAQRPAPASAPARLT